LDLGHAAWARHRSGFGGGIAKMSCVSTTYLRKRRLHDADRADRRYWLEGSYLERFRAVELISNPSLAEHAQQAFPRILRVTHRQRD
jgi:hypothetical protein